MEKIGFDGKSLKLSRGNLFDLSKKLIGKLTGNQLLQLMSAIVSLLVENTKGHMNHNKVPLELFAMGENPVDAIEVKSVASMSDNSVFDNHFVNRIPNHKKNMKKSRNINRTARRIIERQCGNSRLSIKPNNNRQGLLKTSVFPNSFGLNSKSSTLIEASMTNLVDSTNFSSLNVNNTINEQYLFNSKYGTNMFRHKVPPTEIFENQFGTNDKCGLKFIAKSNDNASDRKTSFTKRIYESYQKEIDKSSLIGQIVPFPDIFPVSCVPWRCVTPYMSNVSGIYRSYKSTSITRRLQPIIWPQKSTVKDEHRKEKRTSSNRSNNTKFIYNQKLSNARRIGRKVNLGEFPNMYISDSKFASQDKMTDLKKVTKKQEFWSCTYVACRHINVVSDPTCVLCFNPRWISKSRFVRDRFCLRCGYVNYKTRISCKKCNLQFSSKSNKVKRRFSIPRVPIRI